MASFEILYRWAFKMGKSPIIPYGNHHIYIYILLINLNIYPLYAIIIYIYFYSPRVFPSFFGCLNPHPWCLTGHRQVARNSAGRPAPTAPLASRPWDVALFYIVTFIVSKWMNIIIFNMYTMYISNYMYYNMYNIYI